MHISTKAELFKILEEHHESSTATKRILGSYLIGSVNDGYEMLEINSEEFINKGWNDLQFQSIRFVNCKFVNFKLWDVNVTACEFFDCEFINSEFSFSRFFESEFRNCTFENSRLNLIHFGDIYFADCKFKNCDELMDIYWGGCNFQGTIINECFISFNRFENTVTNRSFNIVFLDCFITRNYFSFLNFNESKFNNSTLTLNNFQCCELKKESFINLAQSEIEEYNSIDFQTISQSEALSPDQLFHIFGITSSDIKEYIYSLSNKISFQTIFISYSTKDLIFAVKLNEALMRKGIITFMWEKDSSGGKQLKTIMRENIEKYDRVLFISSQNSLKSEACHFELTQGRLKQDKTWKEAYFPITIDDFIFKVRKEDIRPRDKMEEYWKNICELKEFNIIDYSNEIDETDFERKILSLIRCLKK